jgi:hypothetical protein
MPKTRPPYSLEFRRQMVDLVRAGRDPEELAKEFEPTAQSIRYRTPSNSFYSDDTEHRRNKILRWRGTGKTARPTCRTAVRTSLIQRWVARVPVRDRLERVPRPKQQIF